MEKNEAVRLIIDLMDISEACCLTTIDQENFPQTRAMLNLRNSSQYPKLKPVFNKLNENFLVYFTTNTSSQKIREIKNNPRVSVYYSQPVEWRGLMLGGNIEIVADRNIKELIWQDGWTLYYPGGVEDKDYTVLRLQPKVMKLYHKLDFSTLHLD